MKIISNAERTHLLERLFSSAKEISTDTSSEMTPEQTRCIEFLKKASGKEVSYETK